MTLPMSAETPRPQANISSHLLTRVVILLIAVWDFLAGLAVLAFEGSSSFGVGLEDRAAQRLLGAHLLLFVPVYLLLAWRPEKYRSLLWLPFAAQAAVVLVVGYNMLRGDTDVGDGILAFAVSLIFVTLLGFVWVTEQRTVAAMQAEADKDQGGPPLPPGPPKP